VLARQRTSGQPVFRVERRSHTWQADFAASV